MSLIRHRWLQEANLNVKTTPVVTYNQHTNRVIHFDTTSLPTALISNPVSSRTIVDSNRTPPPTSRTIGQRKAYTSLTAEVRSLLGNIQTQEQLDEVREKLANIRMKEAQREKIRSTDC
ncbi:hypothetical protein R3P38DRAFT_3588415 [Favolaschia claudopus]|uniref:Uncharacterized protein n=1 Tax=Favolaschia claudopus TaxID=2862362 RepID=A0AAW0AIH0_9AGAR